MFGLTPMLGSPMLLLAHTVDSYQCARDACGVESCAIYSANTNLFAEQAQAQAQSKRTLPFLLYCLFFVWFFLYSFDWKGNSHAV